MRKARQESASKYMERTYGKLTFGAHLRAIRLGEAWSLAAMGKTLGVSAPHLSDIEHDRRTVSPERAAAWAKALGYDQAQFVQLAVQGLLDVAGIKLRVSIKAA
jgi:transcriptional regulator with XRE-family HTH domain